MLNFEQDEDSEKEEELSEIIQVPAAMYSVLDEETKEALPQLPKEARMSMVDAAEEKLAEMEGLVGDSVSVAFVKAAYEELGMDMEEIQMDYLFRVGAKMLLLALLGMVVAIMVTLIAARVAATTSKDLRNKTFEKVVGFSNAEMNNFSTASLITRCTNDIQQIQMVLVMLLRIVAYAPIMGIGGLMKVFRTTPSMAWIIGIAVIAIICLVIILMAVAMPKFKKMQVLVDRLNLVSKYLPVFQ